MNGYIFFLSKKKKKKSIERYIFKDKESPVFLNSYLHGRRKLNLEMVSIGGSVGILAIRGGWVLEGTAAVGGGPAVHFFFWGGRREGV